jgi:cyclohexyl-isocyanide hydratase
MRRTHQEMDYTMTQSYAITVGMVLFPNLTQLDLTGPYEVFARMPDTVVMLVAETLAPVRSERGLTITPDTTFAGAPQFDLICVPGGIGVNPMMEHAPLLDFLRRQARDARYMTSVCTGALLLGAAGLLRGYRAATHWLAMDLLPILGAVPVHERVVIDRNRITGGGITAGIDFGLVVAAELCGREVAERIQLVMEYNPAPPFTSGSPAVAEAALVAQVQAMARSNQEQRLQIAERAATRLRAATP